MLRSTPFLLFDGNCAEARLQELHEMPLGIYGQFYDEYSGQRIFRGKKAAG